MKDTSHTPVNHVEFATAGKKKYVHHFEFRKKDAIIRYLEIIGAGAIILLAGMGIYGQFN